MTRDNARTGAIAGSLLIATIGAATPAVTRAEPNMTPSISVADRTPAPGERVVVSGKAQTSYQRALTLEFRRKGAPSYRAIARTKVGHGDRFRVGGTVPGNGSLRVRVVPNGRAQVFTSRAVAIKVVRDLKVGGRRLHVRAGEAAVVNGRGAPGEPVRLQALRSGRWTTLARATPRRSGRFTLRARRQGTMSAPVRIVSGGRTRSVGRLNVYRYAEASWYGPGLYGGSLACGGILTEGTLGVANKSLPCGSKVTLRNGSRTIRVKVVDRGPYVGNREYDLTAATARKLNFSGAGSILTTR